MNEKHIDATELVTLRDFTAVFWQEYGSGHQCQEDVFWMLDGIYFARFGEHRFSSFDAFRMQRDRSLKKKKE